MVDRRSQRLGARERIFQLQPQVVGIPSRLADALVHGLRGALDDLLVDKKDIHDCERIYVALASNRLRNAYDRWGLTTG